MPSDLIMLRHSESSGTAKDIPEAKGWLKMFSGTTKLLNAELTLSALEIYQTNEYHCAVTRDPLLSKHPFVRSFNWAFSLSKRLNYFLIGGIFLII